MRKFSMLVIAIALLVSCMGDRGLSLEMESIKRELETQRQLIEVMMGEPQIISLKSSNNRYSVVFSNGKVLSFTKGLTPLFKQDSDGVWMVDGVSTGIKGRDGYDSQNGLVPEIELIDSYWYIDGKCSWIPVQERAESQILCLVQTDTGLSVYLVDGTVSYSYYRKSILALNPDSKYAGRMALMDFKSREMEYDPLVICYFSDIHGDKDNMDRILQYCGHYSNYIDDIVHGGDSEPNSFYDSFACDPSVLNSIGNHDTAVYDGEQYSWREKANLPAYERYISPFVKGWGAIQPDNSDSIGACYYYKDYEASNVRLIVLDCMAYDSAQNEWFVYVLGNALSKGLSVIALSHHAVVNSVPFEIPFSFYPFLSQALCPCDWSNFYESVPNPAVAVDDFIKSGGDFMCWLFGHKHVDCTGTLVGYPGQICIFAETASCDRGQSQFAFYPRTIGEKSQDSFNIISFSTDLHTVSLLRIGSNIDNYGRTKNGFCIDYKAGSVISVY